MPKIVTKMPFNLSYIFVTNSLEREHFSGWIGLHAKASRGAGDLHSFTKLVIPLYWHDKTLVPDLSRGVLYGKVPDVRRSCAGLTAAHVATCFQESWQGTSIISVPLGDEGVELGERREATYELMMQEYAQQGIPGQFLKYARNVVDETARYIILLFFPQEVRDFFSAAKKPLYHLRVTARIAKSHFRYVKLHTGRIEISVPMGGMPRHLKNKKDREGH